MSQDPYARPDAPPMDPYERRATLSPSTNDYVYSRRSPPLQESSVNSNKMFAVKTETVDSDDKEMFTTINSEAEDSDGDEEEMSNSDIEAEDFNETEMFTLNRNQSTEPEKPVDETVVSLDTYNSDLNLVIDADRFSAKSLTNEGFAFMWAGARATHGASRGKFCFEVKMKTNLQLCKVKKIHLPNPYWIRVGFSVENSTLQLGEDPLSYGYDGTGKIATNSQYQDFGETFAAGDVILCAVDAESEIVQIGFAKNGQFLGWAFQVDKRELEGHSLFPHIMTKNVSFEVNLGQKEQPYFPLPDPLKDFTFIGCLPLTQRERGTRPPNKMEDCEVIVMCGLPGSGKSTWAAKYAAANPSKKFNVLGVNNILKVMGLQIKRNHKLKYDSPLNRAKVCLIQMEEIASKLNRNLILDQEHLFENKLRLKMMRHFAGFQRKAAVVLPSEAEYRRRIEERDCNRERKREEEGKIVRPIQSMDKRYIKLKEKFQLPRVNDVFKEVIYTELQKEDAEKLIIQYISAVDGPKQEKLRQSLRQHIITNSKFPGISDLFKGLQNLCGSEPRKEAAKELISQYTSRKGTEHHKTNKLIEKKLRKVLRECIKAKIKLPELCEIFNNVMKEVGNPQKKFKSNDSGVQLDSGGENYSSLGLPPRDNFVGRGRGFNGSRGGFDRKKNQQFRRKDHDVVGDFGSANGSGGYSGVSNNSQEWYSGGSFGLGQSTGDNGCGYGANPGHSSAFSSGREGPPSMKHEYATLQGPPSGGSQMGFRPKAPEWTSYSSYAPQINTQLADNARAHSFSTHTPQTYANNNAQYGYNSYSNNAQNYLYPSFVAPSQPTQGYHATQQAYSPTRYDTTTSSTGSTSWNYPPC